MRKHSKSKLSGRQRARAIVCALLVAVSANCAAKRVRTDAGCRLQSYEATMELIQIYTGERTCLAPELLAWERQHAVDCGWITDDDRAPADDR